MKSYSIHMMPEANLDLEKTYQYIAYELMLPITALKYSEGIHTVINDLKTTGNIYAFSQNKYIQSLYGSETRTVRYKKMTIIYNIIGDKIIVRRIVAGSMIR